MPGLGIRHRHAESHDSFIPTTPAETLYSKRCRFLPSLRRNRMCEILFLKRLAPDNFITNCALQTVQLRE